MIAQNRKLLEDIQYRVRKADCEWPDAPDLLREHGQQRRGGRPGGR